MTTPQRSIEDVIVEVVKLIAPESTTTCEDIAKITEHFNFQQVVEDITPLDEDETLDLLDTLAESLPKDVAQEHLTSTFMALLLAKEAMLDE